jgi:hypothetical protein
MTERCISARAIRGRHYGDVKARSFLQQMTSLGVFGNISSYFSAQNELLMLSYIGVIGQDSASNNKTMVRTLERLAQSVPGAKFKSAQHQVVYCLAHKINCAANRFFQAIDSSVTGHARSKPSLDIALVDDEGGADPVEPGDADESMIGGDDQNDPDDQLAQHEFRTNDSGCSRF